MPSMSSLKKKGIEQGEGGGGDDGQVFLVYFSVISWILTLNHLISRKFELDLKFI